MGIRFSKSGKKKIASQREQTNSNESYPALTEKPNDFKAQLEKIKAEYKHADWKRLSICFLAAVIILALIWSTISPAVGGIVFGLCLIVIDKLNSKWSKDE